MSNEQLFVPEEYSPVRRFQYIFAKGDATQKRAIFSEFDFYLGQPEGMSLLSILESNSLCKE